MDIPCASCGLMPARSKCGRCKKARYCSRKCQSLHWKRHKSNCHPSKEATLKDCDTTTTSTTTTTTARLSTSQQRECRDAIQNEYLSQNASADKSQRMNLMFGMLPVTHLQNIYPGYVKLADFPSEFFANKTLSTGLTSPKYRKIVSDEYEGSRFMGLLFYMSYKSGTFPKEERQRGSRELMRRFRMMPGSMEWYFGERKYGDVFRRSCSELYFAQYTSASFSNCPVPYHCNLAFGNTHVAVGFVDLGVLLDCKLPVSVPDQDGAESPLYYYGYDCSPYAVAKALVIWEMIVNGGHSAGPSEVTQVWFSAVWTKKATLAFLAAVKSVAQNAATMAPDVALLIKHWALSKGVGVRTARNRCSETRKEKSNACFMHKKCDRVDMIRYYLTGEFGLQGEAACSGSITMWDCPEGTPPLQSGECVLNTMSAHDVIGSKFWDGNYLRTAEKEKTHRVSLLMALARSGKVKVSVKVAFVECGKVAQDIASLKPHSISWSNVLDYLDPSDFHRLARECSSVDKDRPTAHFGYSMNWPRWTFGATIIDIATTAECMNLIESAAKSIRKSFGDDVFSLPLRANPINTTKRLLAVKYHKSWVDYFFGHSRAERQHIEIPEFNPLSSAPSIISMGWLYP